MYIYNTDTFIFQSVADKESTRAAKLEAKVQKLKSKKKSQSGEGDSDEEKSDLITTINVVCTYIVIYIVVCQGPLGITLACPAPINWATSV